MWAPEQEPVDSYPAPYYRTLTAVTRSLLLAPFLPHRLFVWAELALRPLASVVPATALQLWVRWHTLVIQ